MTERPCVNLSDPVVKIVAQFWEILSEFKITETCIQSKISLKETIINQL